MDVHWVIVAPAAMVVASIAAAWGAAVHWQRDAGDDGYERLLLVGMSPLMVQLAREIDSRPGLHWRIAGIVADLPNGQVPSVGPWLGRISCLAGLMNALQPTRVVVAPRDRRRSIVEEPLLDARLRGVAVEDPIRTIERATGKLPIEQVSPRSLILSDGFRHSDLAPSDSTLLASRAISAVVALGALVLFSPVFALIALAIVLDSKGPVFFVQERIGIGGRPFRLYKFRTMRVAGAHASEWVRDNDARITGIGRWLRRFRLDEWPQFVNVLKGEMALVGPRPQPTSNAALFLERIPHYRLRSAVRPGITGWAQVRYGYANSLDEETEKMRYDLYYIKHRSLWLDLRILAETVGVLIFDRRNHQSVSAPSTRVDPPAVFVPRSRGVEMP